MSLKELKELFQGKDLNRLAEFLEAEKKKLDEEERLLREKRQDVDWLSEFMEYSRSLEVDGQPGRSASCRRCT